MLIYWRRLLRWPLLRCPPCYLQVANVGAPVGRLQGCLFGFVPTFIYSRVLLQEQSISRVQNTLPPSFPVVGRVPPPPPAFASSLRACEWTLSGTQQRCSRSPPSVFSRAAAAAAGRSLLFASRQTVDRRPTYCTWRMKTGNTRFVFDVNRFVSVANGYQ